MMKKLSMCMIGSRGHFGYAIQGLKKLPEVIVTGISTGCEDEIDRLKKSCEELGQCPKIFDDYLYMLDELKPDMVCIDGPFDKHAQMCVDALERDIHVFCEKPVALTLDDLDRIQEAYDKTTDIRFMSMVGLRYEPTFHTAHQAVREGKIGKVKLIKTQKSYRLGERPDFYKKRSTYGGTIPWVGSHAIDWIYWFSGSEFKSVYSTHTTTDNMDHGELEIAAHCMFVMENGVQASASIDFLRPPAAPTHGDDRVRVAGTKGVIEVMSGVVKLINQDGAQELPAVCDKQIFVDFVRDVQGESKALTDGDETISMTRACLLARESADKGELISF